MEGRVESLEGCALETVGPFSLHAVRFQSRPFEEQMGRRGPPPKPSALKKAQGTYRPDRAALREVEPTPGVPEMPRWLDAEVGPVGSRFPPL